MTKEEILKEHADIFDNLHEYALVKNPGLPYSKFEIRYKPTLGYVLIEENSNEIIELMIEKGVQIADSEDEIRPPGFKHYQTIWDEEKKGWSQIDNEEFEKRLVEKRKDKHNP